MQTPRSRRDRSLTIVNGWCCYRPMMDEWCNRIRLLAYVSAKNTRCQSREPKRRGIDKWRGALIKCWHWWANQKLVWRPRSFSTAVEWYWIGVEGYTDRSTFTKKGIRCRSSININVFHTTDCVGPRNSNSRLERVKDHGQIHNLYIASWIPMISIWLFHMMKSRIGKNQFDLFSKF